MFAPYAARPPVNGSTSPIRRVNEQFLAGLAVLRLVPADPTEAAPTAVVATTSTANAATLLFLIMPPCFRVA
jgi:hypothetical protein